MTKVNTEQGIALWYISQSEYSVLCMRGIWKDSFKEGDIIHISSGANTRILTVRSKLILEDI